MSNWKKVKLGSILKESKIEAVDSNADSRIRVLLNANGVIKRPLTKETKGATKYFKRSEGQFIYGKQNLHKGAFGIVPKVLDSFTSSSDLPAFDVDESCLPEWLDYFLKQGDFYLSLIDIAKGAATKRIQPKALFEVEIPLPDTTQEQQEIIEGFKNKERYNELLDSEIQTQKQLLTQLKQSILQEAIQGKLTADWRAKNSPPLEGCLKGGVVKLPTAQDGVVYKRNAKNYFNLPFNPKLKQRAKELRKAGNLSEVLFWNEVKNKQFKGLDFDRQKIIGNYIVDFYCSNCNVVVEIDGSSHDDKQEYDAKRDQYLQDLGLTVIHITVIDIKKKLAETMNWLFEHPVFVLPTDEDTKEPPRPTDTPPKEGNWESASELLKRIKAEKDQLIKDKKIKKEKPLPPITEEEIPFELPDGWVWCRLGEITHTITKGSSPKWQGVQYVEEGVLFITSENVGTNEILLKKKKFVQEKFNEIEPRSILKKGDILTNIVGASIGRTAIWDKEEIANINQAVCLVRFPDEYFNKELLVNTLNSDFGIKLMMDGQFDTGRGNLSLGTVSKFKIPFPPLEEQKAIVEKVESLMQKCQALEEEIQTSEANAQMLMQAVLKEAFEGKEKEVEKV